MLEIEARKTNSYKNVIIYVDDLDRIEPKNAVAVLELLKNIFSVPNCIFILAIDYQVVVKGLEHKFGKQTADNEWEFRAFFDKIIQLPFMMPMGQYNIGKYVNELLKNIGFVTDEGLDDDAVREIITRTIGGNPRSLKRLVNSVALIEIFKQKKSDKQSERDDSDLSENQEKLVLFSLLCLQIAYPYIYSLLLEHNEFHKWNDELAFEKTQRKEEVEIDYPGFQREFENAKNSDDFDEEWERALFRICYVYPRLKPRASEISKFLSYLKDELFKDKQDNIGRTLSSILSQTSVTSVTSTDQQQPVGQFKDAAWKSADQKSISNKLWNMALDVLQDTTVIYKKGRRSGSSGVMRLTDKEIGGDVIFGLHQGPGLYIYISNLNEQVSISLMEKIMSNKEKIEEELGFSVRWEPSNKRAQYIRFDYSDMVKLSQFSKKDWPRPLKSWDNISPRNNLFPMEEDLEIMTKFFAEFAPIFEKVMRKYILKIIQEDN